jgi:hypothetical protein
MADLARPPRARTGDGPCSACSRLDNGCPARGTEAQCQPNSRSRRRVLQRHQPPGPMLNSYNFGGYLMWAYPREKVFIDSRAFMIYSEAHFGISCASTKTPPFFRELEQRWHFRLAVLQRAGRGAGSQHGCARSLTGK